MTSNRMKICIEIKECLSEQTGVDFTDELVSYDVAKGMSIKQLKERIHEKEGYEPEDLSLSIATVPLQNNLLLGDIAQAIQEYNELMITCVIKEKPDIEESTVISDLDEERWIVTGSSGKSFRHYVIPARAKGDKLTIEYKGLLGFLKQEVKFMVVKKEGIMKDGYGDVRWEGASYTLDREKHKQYLFFNKDLNIILKNDNSVEVEYQDNQHGLLKQKLEPDTDSKVYHEQAMAYSEAFNNKLKYLSAGAAAASKLGALAL